jgi:hypothetical protein
MKVSVVLAGLVWPVLAFGQQAYTNADLTKFDVPGAYTNEDLRRLPPLAVQKEPAATLRPFVSHPPAERSEYQESYDALKSTRDSFACELNLELKRVEFSESAFAGDTRSFEPRLGYRVRVASLILELQKRIAILDCQMDDLVDQARRADVTIDQW